MDVLAVYEAVGEAVKHAREEKGPTLVECKTYRFRGHFEGDPNQGTRYRTKQEMKKWKARCPIKLYEASIVRKKLVSQKEVKAMEQDARRRIDEAYEYANKSPFPSGEDALEDVFV
jgi:pyruvate dehydrogenase E1 component alpha subunit